MIKAIITARMGSSRLPGKVLMPIMGRPMLSWQVERVRLAPSVAAVVIATSTAPGDDAVAAFCRDEGIPCFRGSEADVLDRVYQAANAVAADPVIRLTGDDPLADFRIIERCLETWQAGTYDYVANVNPPTFPDGLDVEIVSLRALERIWRQATSAPHREHVTMYLRENMEQFRTANIKNETDLSGLHWAVDEKEHFAFIARVFETLYPKKHDFSMQDVLECSNAKGIA